MLTLALVFATPRIVGAKFANTGGSIRLSLYKPNAADTNGVERFTCGVGFPIMSCERIAVMSRWRSAIHKTQHCFPRRFSSYSYRCYADVVSLNLFFTIERCINAIICIIWIFTAISVDVIRQRSRVNAIFPKWWVHIVLIILHHPCLGTLISRRVQRVIVHWGFSGMANDRSSISHKLLHPVEEG